jgi:glycosyltransferase involved in cell wall biosynthesis
MKIWHVGSKNSPKRSSGITTTIWAVAKEQAKLGHQVTIIVEEYPPKPEELALAEQIGVELKYIPATRWQHDPKIMESLLQSSPPQIVNIHGSFLPILATCAMTLRRHKIPYVVTPNGMLNFRRSRFKKILYSWLLEKQMVAAAKAITLVIPAEIDMIRAVVPRYRGITPYISNPVESDQLDALKKTDWKVNPETKRLVYLGSFDVGRKGLDVLVEIARHLPEAEFHLYGYQDRPELQSELDQLQSNLPPNVYFHGPVFDAEKVAILTSASLYIQTSRWEGFPVSIAEAMYLGIPCAISDMPNVGAFFREQDLGLVLPPDPQAAANRLQEVLNKPELQQHWAERGQVFAQENFQSRAVASKYLKVYEEVLNP